MKTCVCVYLCVYVRVDYDRVSGARYTHMYVDGPVGLAVSGPSGLTRSCTEYIHKHITVTN